MHIVSDGRVQLLPVAMLRGDRKDIGNLIA